MFNMRRLTHTIIFASLSFLSFAQKKADSLLLNNYKPVSIYKTPIANIQRASFPVIDMHSHDYVETKTDVDDLVKLMDKMNVKKTMILTYTTGKGFDSAVEKYSKYPDRFELFCGFDRRLGEEPTDYPITCSPQT